eukprot:TRINITY_DN4567_c0_g1_i1.p1 TRINITY_DN4567_c0_g1~~TRINITY_DN4567_c0_g1_i1.p1  ORF type:complete len:370 (+),score=64.56 TRINITY_DN4567_c0_g1_i1:20-1129(+)
MEGHGPPFKRSGVLMNWLRWRAWKKEWEVYRWKPRYLRMGILLSIGVYFLNKKFQTPPEVVEIGDLFSDKEPTIPITGQKILSPNVSPSGPTFLQYAKYRVYDSIYRTFSTVRSKLTQHVVIPMRAYAREFAEEYRLDFIYELESWNDMLPGSFRFSDWPLKLLPDPMPESMQPMTLCLEMEIFFDPSTKRKRAGVERFLTEASQFTEIVLLSDYHPLAAGKMMKRLDRKGAISFRVGHQCFRRGDERGVLTPRYLNRLNRDLSKVLCLDFSKQMYPENRENVLILPQEKWYLNPHDTDLLDILPVLRGIAKQVSAGQDVRKIVEEYNDVDPARVGRVLLGYPPVRPHFRTLDFQKIKLLPDEEDNENK